MKYNENDFFEIVKKYDDKNVSDEEIIQLIHALANSGEVMKFSGCVYDFASTGGPSSLSTLLVPLYLHGLGVNVINLAVPGRPAGAVDVLAQIEGYDLDRFDNMSKEPFYIHLVANDKFVPMDKALFEYRKKVNKVNVSNLAIASILSKKVASGAKRIGLDIRVSEFGNFGSDWETCRDNAIKYNRLAKILGIESLCFLSDANIPYQRYIGRGESLEALYDIFMGTADEQLMEHVKYCEYIARCLVAKEKEMVRFITKEVDLTMLFKKNLEAQGTEYNQFLHAVERVKEQPHIIIRADRDGYIQYNLKNIREFIVARQKGEREMLRYPDRCGVKLLCNVGEYVSKEEPIISIRCVESADLNEVKSLFMINNNKINNAVRREVI